MYRYYKIQKGKVNVPNIKLGWNVRGLVGKGGREKGGRVLTLKVGMPPPTLFGVTFKS